jgi:CBS domain-containing protein
MLATVVSHAFTVLTLKRSILTEKVARRGFHLSREYSVDPLEILFVREVMRTNVVALPATITQTELAQSLKVDHKIVQMLYPVVDEQNYMAGVVTRRALQELIQEPWPANKRSLAEVVNAHPVVAYADEPLRVVVYRMAETGLTRFPVVAPDDPRRLVGMVSLYDLLQARTRTIEHERHRERVLRLRLPFSTRPFSRVGGS